MSIAKHVRYVMVVNVKKGNNLLEELKKYYVQKVFWHRYRNDMKSKGFEFSKTKDECSIKFDRIGNKINVCFGGTEGIKEMVNNLCADKYKLDNDSYCHEGIYKTIDESYKNISNRIKCIKGNNHMALVGFYGYSRGYGLAVEFARRYLLENESEGVNVIGFAGMRVGGEKYLDDVKDKINCYNIYFKSDFVPKIPTKKMGFVQKGDQIVLKNISWYKPFLPFMRVALHLNYDKYYGYRD